MANKKKDPNELWGKTSGSGSSTPSGYQQSDTYKKTKSKTAVSKLWKAAYNATKDQTKAQLAAPAPTQYNTRGSNVYTSPAAFNANQEQKALAQAQKNLAQAKQTGSASPISQLAQAYNNYIKDNPWSPGTQQAMAINAEQRARQDAMQQYLKSLDNSSAVSQQASQFNNLINQREQAKNRQREAGDAAFRSAQFGLGTTDENINAMNTAREERQNLSNYIDYLRQSESDAFYKNLSLRNDYGRYTGRNADSKAAQALRDNDDINYGYYTNVDNNGVRSNDTYLNSLTDQEKNNYYYLYSTGGKKAADDYIKHLDLDSRLAQQFVDAQTEMAKEYPILTTAMTTFASPATNLAAAIGDITNIIGGTLRGEGGRVETKTTPWNAGIRAKDAVNQAGGEEFAKRFNATMNSLFPEGANVSDTTRSAVNNYISNKDNLTVHNWEDLGKTLYSAAVSAGDSTMSMLLGSTVGAQDFGTMVMSLGAGSRALQSAKERGATDGQAILLSIVSAAAEYVSEHMSSERIVGAATGIRDTARGFIARLSNGVLSEELEETASAIIEFLADDIIMGKNSEFNQTMAAAMAQGYSEEEARKLAWENFGDQMVETWKQTALSTLMQQGPAQVIGEIRGRNSAQVQSGINVYNTLGQQGIINVLDDAVYMKLMTRGEANDLLNNIIYDTRNGRAIGSEDAYQLGRVYDTVQAVRGNEAKINDAGSDTSTVARSLADRVQAVQNPGLTVENNTIEQQRKMEQLDEAANNLFDNEKERNAFKGGYDGQQDVSEYATGYTQVYNAAKNGADSFVSAVSNNTEAQNINRAAAQAAFFSGQNVAKAAAGQENVQNAYRKTADVQTGFINNASEKALNLAISRAQSRGISEQSVRQQFDILQKLAENSNAKIVLVDELGGETNGQYYGGNTIFISVNALDQAYVATATHELGHYIYANNNADWTFIEDKVRTWMSDNDMSLDSEIASYEKHLAKNYPDMDATEVHNRAVEEVVCDHLMPILTNEKNLNDLMGSKEGRSFIQKAADYLKGFVQDLRKILSDYAGDRTYSSLSKLARDTKAVEDLYQKFSEAAKQAGENYQEKAESRKAEGELTTRERNRIANEQTDTEGEIKNSISLNMTLQEDAEKYAAKTDYRYVSKDVLQEVGKIRQQIADYLTKNADKLGLPEDVAGNTIWANGSYGKTIENSLICPRSTTAIEFVAAVSEELGRPLTQEEAIYVSQNAAGYVAEAQCLYCYVAMDRLAYNEYMAKYIDARNEAIKDVIDNGMSVQEAYEKYLDGRKDTKNQKARFYGWIRAARNGTELITKADLASTAAMARAINRNQELQAQIDDVQRYSQSASWAKKQQGYRAYNGNILKMSDAAIQKLNKLYGLRMYSFSDYSPAYVLENMQMITDAAVKGAKVLAYTKSLDFVKTFASTGAAINVSVFAFDRKGQGIAEDDMYGANWAEARALREKYPNVGITFTATNDRLVEWALQQDWIDVVIPFHLVKTGKVVADLLNYTNYTSESSDVKTKEWVKGRDLASITPAMHHNDKQAYLDACERNHLEPRFKRWIDNPGYMKLVNETRLSADDIQVVQPIFNKENVQAAYDSLDNLEKVGGYVQHVGGSIENMRDIAEENAEAIRKGGVQSFKEFNQREYGVKNSESISMAKLNEQYMDAYYDGDDDAMQELVDIAAKKAGYNYKAFHHTENSFTVFDRSKARRSMDVQGFFFSADPDAESEYGSVRYDVYLKMNNPYIVNSKESWDAFPMEYGTEDAGVKARERLQELGYDGVIRDAEYFGGEADEYIVFEPEQIKSAEPVVYADDEYGEGEVIPLSKRFNKRRSDIRYSERVDMAPKKTIDVYKLMRLGQDGKLYPLFIDSSGSIDVGVWYDADSPDMEFLKKMPDGVFLVDSNTQQYMSLSDYLKEKGRKQTKFPSVADINDAAANGMRWVYLEPTNRSQKRFEGENRKYWNLGINGSGSVATFSMRPGYHAGSLPTMRQIGKGPNKNLRDDTFVWTKGRMPADIDYQAEADRNPEHDIPTHIPKNGYYMKATNADSVKSQADRVGWYVGGSYIVDEIISDSEARAIIDEWNDAHPDQQVEYDYERESGKVFNAKTMSLEKKSIASRIKNSDNFDMGLDIDKMSNAEYNLYKWAGVNEVLNKKEFAAFMRAVESVNRGEQYYVNLPSGMKAIPFGERDGVQDVIVITDGRRERPSIERVIRIDLANETDLAPARAALLELLKEGYSDEEAISIITDVPGQEIYRSFTSEDFPSLSELRRQRRNSGGVDETSGTLQDRTGSNEVDRGELSSINNEAPENGAFSVKKSENVVMSNYQDELKRDPSNKQLQARVNQLENMVAGLREQFEITKGVKLSQKGLERVAKVLIRDYSLTEDVKQLASEINDVFGTLLQEQPTYDEFHEAAYKLANRVIDDARIFDRETYEHFADLRKYLSQNELRINENQQKEINALYGSMANFEKATGLKISTKSGIDMEDAWAELAGMGYTQEFPNAVEDSIPDADMPEFFAQAKQNAGKQYINPYGYNEAEVKEDFVMALQEAYYDVPEVQTYADKQNKKFKQMQAKYRTRFAEYRAQAREQYNEKLKQIKADAVKERQEIALAYAMASGRQVAKYKRQMIEGIDRVKMESRQMLESEKSKIRTAADIEMDRLRERYNQALSNERQKRNEIIAANNKWRRDQSWTRWENQQEEKYRKSLTDTATKLRDYMTSPNYKDMKYVPDALKGYIIQALDAVDFTGKRGGMRAQNEWQQSIGRLRNYIQQLAKDESIAFPFQEDIVDAFNDYMIMLDNREQLGINQMMSGELRQLDYIMKQLYHGVKDANRLIRNKRTSSLAKLGDDTLAFTDSHREYNEGGKAKRYLDIDTMDAYTYGSRLGDPGEAVIGELNDGMNRSYGLLRQVSDDVSGIKERIGIRDKDMRTWENKVHEVKLDSGKTVKMTIPAIMEFYALSRRQQGLLHILGDGITMKDFKYKVNAMKTLSVHQGETFAITENDIAKINSLLTDKQQRMIAALQTYLSTTFSGRLNEVSQELYGVDSFLERAYWPISSDTNALKAQEPEMMRMFNAMLNSSFTKLTNNKARNALMIGNAFDTFTNHVSAGAKYYGLAIPVQDAMKWFNYKQRDEQGYAIPNREVKRGIERAMGKGGKAFFTNLISDINGISPQTWSTDISGTLLGHAKAAAVAGKLRVVIQQPTALPKAAIYIPAKYIAKTAIGPRAISEMQEHSSLAWWKAQGNYEIGTGKSMRSVLLGGNSVSDNIRDALMAPAGFADDVTWAHMWEACKAWVKDTTDLKAGSDEFFAEVDKRFNEVVTRTQVVDSVLTRTQVMRDKNGLVKQASAFMSEPMKSYNMMMRAYYELRNADSKTRKEKAYKLAVKTALWSLATTVLNAAVTAAYDTSRKRDKDEEWLEQFKDTFVNNVVEDLIPFSNVPVLSEATDTIKNLVLKGELKYEEPSDLKWQAFGNAITTLQNWVKYFDNNAKWSLYKLLSSTAKAISDIAGQPYGGTLTSLEQLYNIVGNYLGYGEIETQSEYATNTLAYKNLYEYLATDHNRKGYDNLYKIMNDKFIKDGKNETEAKNSITKGIIKVLKDEDDRIAEMAEIRSVDWDYTRYKELYNQLRSEGFTEPMIIGAVNGKMGEADEEEEKETKEYAPKAYKNADLIYMIDDAIDSGDYRGADEVFKYLIDNSDAQNPTKNRMDDIWETYRDDYILELKQGKHNIENMMKHFGWTQAELDKKVKNYQSRHKNDKKTN